MALSQCDTTFIDLTVGGHLGEEFCSFRHENWSVSRPLSRSSSSSLDEDVLDETVIPVAAAKKRKSSEDISMYEHTRKSSRIEAKMGQTTPQNKPRDTTKTPLHDKTTDTLTDLDNTVLSGNLGVKQKLFSPVKFGHQSTPTSSSAKSGPLLKQKKNLHTEPKPIDHTSTPLTIQPDGQKGKPVLTTSNPASSTSLRLSVPKIRSDTQIHPEPIKQIPIIENIGIFWDIENISVPPNVSISDLVRRIRNTFVTADKREVEFMCVCDVHKENKRTIDELNSCNVTIVHVACYAKNAADEKLKHYLHRFAQTYASPSTAVVLSGDVNFGPVISNLTGFYTLNTILIHNLQCSANLKEAAKKAILFDEFIQGIGPPRHITHNQPSFLLVDNLPRISYGELYNRLDRMCDNTGGKIVNLERLMAVIKFSTLELCMRAQKRLNNHCLRPGLLPIRARFSPQTIKAFK
eukprot:TRINITY_DN237_c0_g1_i3.p1 TRINITY_DN237_c0_g1~~TRINITY_DN237_c0_g1_i3.p1  ORF type:complete len:462 (+),score=100.81 TRINITY_DN237_c0_g1_i3:192-1577(+)